MRKRKTPTAQNKKGSYLVEAAMTLPVFILCVIALTLLVRVIAVCENIGFSTSGRMREIGLYAYQNSQAVSLCRLSLSAAVRKDNPALQDFSITNFDYLYADRELEDLIAVDTRAIFHVRNPIGIYGKIVFTQGICIRAFTGSLREEKPLSATVFTSEENAVAVIVFPKYGYCYHSPGCRYVRQHQAEDTQQLEMDVQEARAKGYAACSVCKGGGDV